MSVVLIFRLLLLAAEIWIAVPILYLCIIAITAILVTKKRKTKDTNSSSTLESSSYNFAILVSAHDEELLLGNLLKSLSSLSYPQERYTVYVVADNCTDKTAELARAAAGVRVYERFDTDKRGKGYALNWILQKLEENQLIYDAYVILDADSMVESTFLQWLAKGLAEGHQALQARYSVLNATDSPTSALRWIALTLHNHIRPLGRSSHGGSSTLTGNGMCFSHALLERYPWQAFSLSEDCEYYRTLIRHGERVHYVPEAVVHVVMPTTFRTARTQDIRWESMRGKAIWPLILELLKAGLRLHKFACFEAVMELLTPPLSFLAGWCLLTLIASLLVWSPLALLLSLMLIGSLTLYVSTAFYLVRPPRTVYKALLYYAPAFIVWKLWVLLVLRGRKKHTSEWIRTHRDTVGGWHKQQEM